MKTKIAPDLRDLLTLKTPEGGVALVNVPKALAQLRALLAVAREVQKGVAHAEHCTVWDPEHECACNSRDALRALARLRKVSGGTR